MSGFCVGHITGPQHDVQIKAVNILLHAVPKHVKIIPIGLLQLFQKIHSNLRPELSLTGALGGSSVELASRVDQLRKVCLCEEIGRVF